MFEDDNQIISLIMENELRERWEMNTQYVNTLGFQIQGKDGKSKSYLHLILISFTPDYFHYVLSEPFEHEFLAIRFH